MVQKRRKKAKPIPEPVKPQPPAKCIGCEWGTFTGKSLYCPRMPCIKEKRPPLSRVKRDRI
ncbi:hypothetical protein YDYSY3_57730 [Paenibacillus chitinolyticus]|nr:hypothetical protein YDYSY3_57730 [Paenibacillus chitinolyticus]